MDERYRDCRILADHLGLGDVEQRPTSPNAPLIRVGDIDGIFINGGMFAFTRLPPAAEVIARARQEQAIVGWRIRSIAGGRGSAIVLGAHWRQSRREHERLLRALLADCETRPPWIECDNPNVWAILRSDGQRVMLFLLNLFTSPMETSVRFRDPVAPQRLHDVPGLTLPPTSVHAWIPNRGFVYRSDET